MRSRGVFTQHSPKQNKHAEQSECLPKQLQQFPDPFILPGRTDHVLLNRVEATTRRNSEVYVPELRNVTYFAMFYVAVSLK